MNEKILLIEEDPSIKELLTLILDRSGYEVTCVDDARQAIEKMCLDKPDLVISDSVLPDLDGVQMCRVIRSNTLTAGTPLLVLASHTGVPTELGAVKTGVNDCLLKPFEPKDLSLRIDILLRREQRARALRPELAARAASAPIQSNLS
ncbi:MAG: hypothetical protein A2902_02115 [Elusimicrobia bacterium RIFCSPLOWO2_01_FULL_64_13]|nr:MAG: hypothetical protein A2636_05240 [Elusimicrobia bacterium RIFCSPHIGHO2_01_FULL_64_10]OGR95145.1 MAG: hypothetical protein A2902_02115 [Elusimicrobia bacterium RIFCSPLOWO2_01_FULL_64_13]